MFFRFILILVLIPSVAFSQHKKISFSFTPGLMYYQGDLSGGILPEGNSSHLSLEFDVGYRFNKLLDLTFGYTYGKISGDDANVSGHESRNLRFESNISDIKLLAYVDANAIRRMIWPRKLMKRLDLSKTFSGPHLILGVGYLHFNPKAKHADGKVYELQELGTEGQLIEGGEYPAPYKLWQINVKYGLGMGYYVSRQFHIELQFIYNQVFTDFLDDVSGNYPDYNELVKSENGDIAEYFTYGGRDGSSIDGGTPRGNTNKNDGIISIGLKFSYIFSGDELTRWLNF